MFSNVSPKRSSNVRIFRIKHFFICIMYIYFSIEILRREREKLLHPLEILSGTEKQRLPRADPARVIKSFSRSAAGVDFTDPTQLRPANVLLLTVKYINEK